MVRTWSFLKTMGNLRTPSARRVPLCKLFEASNVILHDQLKNTCSISSAVGGVALRTNAPFRPKSTLDLHEQLGKLSEQTRRIRPKLNETFALPRVELQPQKKAVPLASLVLNHYTPGHVVCADYTIFFQIGGVARFKEMCKRIKNLVLISGKPRHYQLQEFRQLEVDDMVLCDEGLQEIMMYGESGNFEKLAVPGALYRGRLVQAGATLPADCTGRWDEESWTGDRLEVELVDLGVCGHVHVSKIMPMPDAVADLESMAITIGMSEGDYMKYEGDEDSLGDRCADEAFEECCEYVQNVQFKPLFAHPDAEHKSFGIGIPFLEATSIRRADGLIKFEMPENVEKVPDHVLKLISKGEPFSTSVTWVPRNLLRK